MGTSSLARLGSSGSSDIGDLICRVIIVGVKVDDNTSGEEVDYMCEIADEQIPNHGMMFFMSLPDDFVDQHPELDNSETFISIHNGKAVVSPYLLVSPHGEYPRGARTSTVGPSGSYGGRPFVLPRPTRRLVPDRKWRSNLRRLFRRRQ